MILFYSLLFYGAPRNDPQEMRRAFYRALSRLEFSPKKEFRADGRGHTVSFVFEDVSSRREQLGVVIVDKLITLNMWSASRPHCRSGESNRMERNGWLVILAARRCWTVLVVSRAYKVQNLSLGGQPLSALIYCSNEVLLFSLNTQGTGPLADGSSLLQLLEQSIWPSY